MQVFFGIGLIGDLKNTIGGVGPPTPGWLRSVVGFGALFALDKEFTKPGYETLNHDMFLSPNGPVIHEQTMITLSDCCRCADTSSGYVAVYWANVMLNVQIVGPAFLVLLASFVLGGLALAFPSQKYMRISRGMLDRFICSVVMWADM